MAVDAFLRERLLAARPGYGWVSEESASEGAGHRRVFVVDPIDGTRGFLDGTDNWTISMAVVEVGRPVSAVLVQPTRERLFATALGRGAFLDGARLRVREPAGLAGTTIAGSRSFARAARTHGVEEVRFIHSLALRIAWSPPARSTPRSPPRAPTTGIWPPPTSSSTKPAGRWSIFPARRCAISMSRPRAGCRSRPRASA
jgi:hypothetical protein